MDPWGSHLPALLSCLAATDGPVLEVGVGNYSTPLLHALCYPKRDLVSVESDLTWFKKFADDYKRAGHEFLHSPDFGVLKSLAQRQWSTVFLDHSPGERRGLDALLFRDKADYIVIHDYSFVEIQVNGYLASQHFPYVTVSSRFSPSTLVLGREEIPIIP